MRKELANNIAVYLNMYRDGALGSPENPNRGNTAKHAFWTVYNGSRKAREYQNMIIYPAARAGEIARKQDTNNG